MATFAADKLLGRMAKNYDKAMAAYAPDFVTEVIAALNQDALHPDPASPYKGQLLTNDRYLPLLGTVPVWRFTALEPATIQKIGIRNLQWLDMSEANYESWPMTRERFDYARYGTWLDYSTPYRLAEQYTDAAFQEMSDKGWVKRAMTFPPVAEKTGAINFELDSITREEFLGQIARSVRHIAEHVPMDKAALENLGQHSKDGLLYTGDGILSNPHFMQTLCARQEVAIQEGQTDRPLDALFSAMRSRLWRSSELLDHIEWMPLRGRDFAMLAEARLRNSHDSIHPVGFSLDTLSDRHRTFSAVPELLMVASNRVMEEIASRLKDAPHYPIDWQNLQGMDFSANAAGMDMLREGIQAIAQLPAVVRNPDFLPKDA